MTPERWRRIEELYHAARERDATLRAAYLYEACAGDDDLRQEVESLLAQDEQSGSFLKAPPLLDRAAQALHPSGEEPTQSLIGRQLQSYQVLSKIGEGGMGEVYRALDTKLRRDVALKVLPSKFASDPERMVRFRREAQLLASLNHKNVAAIHGFEETPEANFLVLELVEGETFRERIKRQGPLPIQDALTLAGQVAEGLEAAHRKGITHRDIKPANIKVTPEGEVKVLDFGLAKAFAGNRANPDLSESLTLEPRPTRDGQILGTPAYMSPEQVRGQEVDKRTDIWAFGCLLYELLTGHRPFPNPSRDRKGAGAAGSSVADTISAVLEQDPDWSLLPSSTPPNVCFALRRCLEKDANRRFHSAVDVAIALEEPWSVSAAETPAPVPAIPRSLRQRIVPLSLAAIALVFLTSVATWILKPAPLQNPVHLTVTLPPGDRLWNAQNPIALSPDGQRLVYAVIHDGVQQLFVRSLDSTEAQPLSGTEGAAAPFFSPDGEWIGFFADGQLKKISVDGGPPFTIAEAGAVAGAAWGADDTIVFPQTVSSGLMRVSSDGGTPEVLTTLDRTQGEVSHRWPQFLPGGEALLFTVTDGGFGWDGSNLSVLQLNSGERRVVVRGGHTGRYAPTGHLLYYREGNLQAVPFDPVRLEVTSAASTAVVEKVRETGSTISGEYSFAATGTLAYVPGNHLHPESRLVWVDRDGEVEALSAPIRRYMWPRISPDGQQIALTIVSDSDDVWIYSLARGTLSPVTFEGSSYSSFWTPDASQVVYRGARGGLRNIYWRAADGTGPEERLTTGENRQTPMSVSSDGKWLAYGDQNPVTGEDIWVASLEDGQEPQAFLNTNANEDFGSFSPDGRWLAYASDQSGRYEVYVQPFPGPGRRFQVSTDGGLLPQWNPQGGELFYLSFDNKLMVVDVTTSPAFRTGRPRVLFDGLERSLVMCCEPSRDGQRFLAVQPIEPQQPPTQINIVLNWFEELKQRVPVP